MEDLARSSLVLAEITAQRERNQMQPYTENSCDPSRVNEALFIAALAKLIDMQNKA